MHAKYSPSAAKRWLNCPGSIHKFPEPKPQTPTAAALLGTAAHWIFEDPKREGAAPNGIVIDEEMRACVERSHAEIEHLTTKAAHIFKEVQLEIGASAGLSPNVVFGTADLILQMCNGQLHLIDFKYGRYPVLPRQNMQMLTYAVALLPHLKGNATGVHLHILQPKAGGLKSWFASKQEIENHSQKIYQVVTQQDKTLNLGEWCHFCPHKDKCDALPF